MPKIISDPETGELRYDGANPESREHYIRYKAVQDQFSGNNCTYVVYDRFVKCAIAYFSLKAGTVRLYDPGAGDEYVELLPGIELSMFAVNNEYTQYTKNRIRRINGIGAGEYVYRKYVLPIIRDVSEKIGVNILFLFALPDENLIKYYKEHLGFCIPEKDEIKRCKPYTPSFDEGCIFMYQMIKPQF